MHVPTNTKAQSTTRLSGSVTCTARRCTGRWHRDRIGDAPSEPFCSPWVRGIWPRSTTRSAVHVCCFGKSDGNAEIPQLSSIQRSTSQVQQSYDVLCFNHTRGGMAWMTSVAIQSARAPGQARAPTIVMLLLLVLCDVLSVENVSIAAYQSLVLCRCSSVDSALSLAFSDFMLLGPRRKLFSLQILRNDIQPYLLNECTCDFASKLSGIRTQS